MNTIPNPLDLLDQYNITWTEFAQTDRSSMPIGNGEVGVNLWVQRDEINFYFARTDARTETDRSVKLGKIRLSFPANADLFDHPFSQTLVLRDGRIELDFGTGTTQHAHLEVFVDLRADRDLRDRAILNPINRAGGLYQLADGAIRQ